MQICTRVSQFPANHYLQPTLAAAGRHSTHDVLGKGPNETTCDILVPNELKNAEHLTV